MSTEARLLPLPPRRAAAPRVSAVMPTFRRAGHVGASMRSLLAQTWTGFELLVRDDGDGRDGTAEAVQAAAAGDARVRYHRNEARLGMPGNLNAGIRAASGDLIAVCHDHDIYKPRFLATMLETLGRHPGALFVHCGIDVISQGGAYVRSRVGEWPELSRGRGWLEFMLTTLHCPVCALAVVRREAHERHGLYDLAYGFIADVEMWMRLAMHGDVAYVREALVEVREREADHWAIANTAAVIRTTAQIHRRYLGEAYGPADRLPRRLRLEWRVASALGRTRAARAVGAVRRHRRIRADAVGVTNG